MMARVNLFREPSHKATYAICTGIQAVDDEDGELKVLHDARDRVFFSGVHSAYRQNSDA